MSKKSNTKDFIDKAKKIHGNKYDYSKVEYINNHTKVCIICPEHGEFWQKPNDHLNGSGCPKCAGKFLDRDFFIEKSKKIHNNKYDYSKVEYKDNKTAVCIICPEHGEFWQKPNGHLIGNGCPKCGSKESTLECFIEKCKKIHGEKFDYSETVYVNKKTPIDIICKQHGKFTTTPTTHLEYGACPLCKKEKIRRIINKEEFIKESKKIHGEKYDYSLLPEAFFFYDNITLICPKHGEFITTPYKNIKLKRGCTKCNNRGLSSEEWIERFKKIHGDEYDYSEFQYNGNDTKSKIICKKHGIFFQEPFHHLSGEGCPKCRKHKKEMELAKILEERSIKYEYEKTFPWLIYVTNQRLDFFLSEYNVAIEYQGMQHFKPVDFAGKGKEWAEEMLKETKTKDKNKYRLCEKHGIKIFYILYNENISERVNEILSQLEIKR